MWQRNHEIPDALSDLIDRLLEKKPGKRFSTAEEVQQHLATLLSKLQQGSLGRRRFRAWRSRRLRRSVLTGFAAIVITVLVAYNFGDRRSTTPSETRGGRAEASAVSNEASTVNRSTFEEARALIESERQFAGALQHANSALQSPGDNYFIQDPHDPWQRELESLKRSMDEYESQTTSIISQ